MQIDSRTQFTFKWRQVNQVVFQHIHLVVNRFDMTKPLHNLFNYVLNNKNDFFWHSSIVDTYIQIGMCESLGVDQWLPICMSNLMNRSEETKYYSSSNSLECSTLFGPTVSVQRLQIQRDVLTHQCTCTCIITITSKSCFNLAFICTICQMWNEYFMMNEWTLSNIAFFCIWSTKYYFGNKIKSKHMLNSPFGYDETCDCLSGEFFV